MKTGLKNRIAAPFFRFALAAGIASAAVALRFAFTAWVGPGLPTYILFYPTVMAAALLAGFAPGLVATAILTIASAFWFIPPFGEFKITSPVDRLGVLIFLSMSILMCILAESYRRNRDKAAAYDRERALNESKDKFNMEIRSSEERYRTLFNGLIEGFCVIEMIFDKDEKPVDYRFLEVNESFEEQTGMHDAAGKRMREIAPDHEQYWFDIYGKVASTGEAARFVNEAKALNRWFEVHAFRVGPTDSRNLAICFKDISTRMYAEMENARLLKEAVERAAELEATISSLATGMIVYDRSGKALRMNEAAKELLPKELFMDLSIEERLKVMRWETEDGQQARPEMIPVARALRGETAHNVVLAAVFPDRKLWISASAAPIKTADNVMLGAVASFVDITPQKSAEEQLLKNRELLRGVIDNTSALIYVIDRDEKFVVVNNSVAGMFGFSPEKLLGMTRDGLMDVETVKSHEENDRKIFDSGCQMVFEEQDGSGARQVTYLSVKFPIRDANGEIFAIGGISTDITPQINAKETLQTALDRFYLLLSNMPSAVLIVAEDGRIEFANRHFCDMFGLKESTEDLKNLTSPDVIGMIRPAYRYPDAAIERILEIVGKDEPVRNEDVQMQNGREYLRDFVPIQLGTKRMGRMWIHKDITERRLAEAAVRESEQRLKFHFENSPLAVVEWDSDFIVTQWSSEAEKIFGWKKEETLGKRIDTLNMIYEDDVPIVNATIERLSGGKETMVVSSNRNYTKSGAIIECSWYNSILPGKEGKMSSVMSLVQDITEKKRAEEVLKRDNETFLKIVQKKTKELIEAQLELEKAKRLSDIGMLSATVAHELRNPIAVIGVAAYNIRRKTQDPALDRHLASIQKKVEEGSQIINNLLFYSRLKPPNFEKAGIFGLLEESITAIQDKHIKSVPITSEIGDVRVLDIDADPVQLREVFNNLLNNAYDAIPAEGGFITVKAEKQPGNVMIKFHNNGAAIAEENLSKVFDPFFTTKTKGTGLGLSVCRQIIDFHKGSISVESTQSTGTDFTVTLPIQR